MNCLEFWNWEAGGGFEIWRLFLEERNLAQICVCATSGLLGFPLEGPSHSQFQETIQSFCLRSNSFLGVWRNLAIKGSKFLIRDFFGLLSAPSGLRCWIYSSWMKWAQMLKCSNAQMLQPPFYLPSKVRIFWVIFAIRIPSKPSIVFSPQKPSYSQPNYSSWLLCIFWCSFRAI